MKVVLIGGGGFIGAKLVKRLKDLGHEAVAASRTSGVDAMTGAGLAAAFKDAQVVIDVTNAPSFEPVAVMNFFQTSTRNLLSAEAEAGVRHHIVLSVVGADRMTEVAYMRAKIAQERLVIAGPIPYTIVRATQFFEFLGVIADGGTEGDTTRLAPVQMQPIAADDVVTVLAGIAAGAPSNSLVDLAGPDRTHLVEVVRRLLNAKRDARQVIADPQAFYFGGKLDDQSLVPVGPHLMGMTHFEDWLGSHTG
ncbi:SDR family oxidoreductase [Nitrospira lenta]|uniref:dTDP-4-dehydrorhamnose reductase n=1 Tax=Nitrospira lenta TaxID=1436998 RepID=A0A330L305_9BACT|nr:SDR family oxidoreductase [Nitrospira lenta]SPP64148.1 dTDP-4-dehydrorhamnose reductase [Nitrospira lenta]